MNNKIISNVLSAKDLNRVMLAIKQEMSSRPIINQDMLKHGIDRDDCITYVSDIGRIDIRRPFIPEDIINNVTDIVKNNVDDIFTDLVFDFLIYAEYSNNSGGKPALEPHFDVSDAATLIFDYQLESNISWEIIIESENFKLEDNSGILFDPLENIHYRPIKEFKDDHFVKMLFFRFSSTKKVIPKSKEEQFRLSEVKQKYKSFTNE